MPRKSQTRKAKRGADAAALTLAVDIGGSGIIEKTIDAAGKPINERARILTPNNETPEKVIAIVKKLAKRQAPFDRVSVGFPGVIKDGVVYSAPNLGKGWKGYKLESALSKSLKH